MKKSYSLSKLIGTAALAVLAGHSLNAQIVINEVLPGSTVELKNMGSTTVDISSYYLCNFPAYQQLSASNVACGNLNLAPGMTVVVDDFSGIGQADGEMGLYTSPAYASSDAIVDYVEWGSAGHQRSSVAQAAGIWGSNMFVTTPGSGESLHYSGSGDDANSWSAGDPTICAADIIINKVYPGSTVELKNIGFAAMDISSYYLCNFPAYQQLSASDVICGSLNLAPGETVAVGDFSGIGAADGEMGLYSDPFYASSDAIVDYVEWGSAGHQRSSVAIGAGIWTADSFVPAISTDMAIKNDGMGSAVSNWSEVQFIACEDVATSTDDLTATAEIMQVYPQPASNQLTIVLNQFNVDQASIALINGLGQQVIGSNQITSTSNGTFQLDMSALPQGTYHLLVNLGNETRSQLVIK